MIAHFAVSAKRGREHTEREDEERDLRETVKTPRKTRFEVLSLFFFIFSMILP